MTLHGVETSKSHMDWNIVNRLLKILNCFSERVRVAKENYFYNLITIFPYGSILHSFSKVRGFWALQTSCWCKASVHFWRILMISNFLFLCPFSPVSSWSLYRLGSGPQIFRLFDWDQPDWQEVPASVQDYGRYLYRFFFLKVINVYIALIILLK